LIHTYFLIFDYFDLANHTYDKKGAINVGASTSGGERVKISLAFTASAAGTKLPILVVIPRKNPLKKLCLSEQCCNCLQFNTINNKISYKSQTFDTEVIQNNFIRQILLLHMGRHKKQRILLHLDNSPVHKRKDIMEIFRANSIEVSYLPARMTSLLQPADVGWFRSLKSQYHKRWQVWYLNAPKAFTSQHNLKSPGYFGYFSYVDFSYVESIFS